MKLFVFLSLVGVAVGGTLYVEDFPTAESEQSIHYFKDWMIQHGKIYDSVQEKAQRYIIFMDNMKKAATLNSLRKNSESARFGPTHFADLTEAEFEQKLLSSFKSGRNGKVKIINSTAAPESFDWSDKGHVVTSIKNQGYDGTCWAFAGLANVESQYGIKSGKLSPDLSPESLNDCDGYSNIMEGAVACGVKGATMPAFYIWVKEQGGFMSEKDYPYCVGFDQCSPCAPPDYNTVLCDGPWPISPCNEEDSCSAKYDPAKFVPGIKVKDYYFIKQDEKILVEALYELGPLVAGIDATDMQLYTGGVLEPNKCSPQRLNHAVVIVGYGASSSGEDVWRVKNSWGTSWGEKGFFRIQRGTGACGINLEVSTVELE